MTDWVTAGARHDIEGGGHWHEPDYPSCVVCRMRNFEELVGDSVRATELAERIVHQANVMVVDAANSIHEDSIRKAARMVVVEWADGCGLDEDWRRHPASAFEERIIELEKLLDAQYQ